ncbi:hypothetical protein [Actinacidiphila glaucinigra]
MAHGTTLARRRGSGTFYAEAGDAEAGDAEAGDDEAGDDED